MDTTPTTWPLVAERVAQAMEDQGVTQLGLSRSTGIPRVTLIRRLKGQAPFTLDELEAVAAELGIAMSDLVAAA